MDGEVISVGRSAGHTFGKPAEDGIRLLAGLGVEGDPTLARHGFKDGLMGAVLDRDERGNIVRKAGIMGVVVAGGEVRPGDGIRVELPPEPHRPLEQV